MSTKIVRRSVALPRALVEEVTAAAPKELRGNLNRLVTVALREFAARKKAEAFASAIAEMAADPEIQRECANIGDQFRAAEHDGLSE